VEDEEKSEQTIEESATFDRKPSAMVGGKKITSLRLVSRYKEIGV
jgi:hypothetical protein